MARYHGESGQSGIEADAWAELQYTHCCLSYPLLLTILHDPMVNAFHSVNTYLNIMFSLCTIHISGSRYTPGARNMNSTEIEIGMRVEAGKGDDHDTGKVMEIEGDQALVAWQTQVRTWAPIADLVIL